MPQPFESKPAEPPDYGDVPLPPTSEETAAEQSRKRARDREAAEGAFRETLTTGVRMDPDFRARYEKKLGKLRVEQLIWEFEHPDLFSRE